MNSDVSRGDVACQVMDALDVGVLLIDERFRVLSSNAAARSILEVAGVPLEAVEDAALLDLLATMGPLEPTQFSNAVAWVNGEGARVFVRCKLLQPFGVLVTLNRDRLRERDLVDLLRSKYGLTVRQQQIVLLLRNGLSNREIAERIGVSEATVKTYLTVVFQAFEVPNRTSLLARIERLRPER